MANAITRQHIHESNLIEGFDDPSVDDAALQAWAWFRHKKVLTHRDIQELQRRLTAHQPELDDMWRGTYRDRSRVRVYVGGREGVSPAIVGRAMDDWLDRFPTSDPKQSHIEFEHIHPFIDGNGRTGRMLMWWLQAKRGEKPTLITYADRQAYYDWF